LPVRFDLVRGSSERTGCPLRAHLDPGSRTRRRGKPPRPSSYRPESYRPRSASTFAFPGQPRHGGGRPWEFIGK
jgi:hypothetical protein